MWINGWFPMFCGSTNAKKLAKYENNLEWQNTFVRLTNLCLNMFEWEGLPDSCNERYLEQALFFEGKFALVDDPKYGFLSLRANPNNIYNIYGDYDKVHVYGFNGYENNFNLYMEGADNSEAQAVLCRDNILMYPYMLYVIIATDRLTQAMRSIDTASYQLKTPYFIQCDESQKLSIDRILSDIGNNKPAIITTKAVSSDDFKILQTGANPAILQQMWDNYYKQDNNIRSILGIQNNAMPDKSERLLVDEINSNNEVTNLGLQIRLKSREKFCEQVNELFGLNISVKLKNPQDNVGGELDVESSTRGNTNNNVSSMETD